MLLPPSPVPALIWDTSNIVRSIFSLIQRTMNDGTTFKGFRIDPRETEVGPTLLFNKIYSLWLYKNLYYSEPTCCNLDVFSGCVG